MILKAFQYGPLAPAIRPAPPDRAWMDAFQDRHAYRCLPLTISNTFGWEILSPCDLTVAWNGGEKVEDLQVTAGDDYPLLEHFAKSNFSRGIVTLHTGYIFQTEPGWSLMATGPLNKPLDGLAPLTGVIETDWLPYPFTMNWQVTRPGFFRFAKDEPFCHVFPVRQDMFEDVTLQIAEVDAEPGLRERQEAFAKRRGELMAAQAPGANVPAWGREYFRGTLADGFEAPRHTHKMRLPDPIDLRPPRSNDPEATEADVKPKSAAAPKAKAAKGAAQSAANAWWSGDPATLPLVDAKSIGSEVLTIEGFLSAEQCAVIRDAFTLSMGALTPSPSGDAFWDERVLWFDQVSDSAAHAKAIMQQARYVTAYRIAEHFGAKGLLYSDSQQLVIWREGAGMPVHVDNAHPDGSLHNTPHREFASVVYLNDDFEGGEIYFPRLQCRLKPSAGLLVAFRGTAECPHGVAALKRGERMTMPCWYSSDPSVAERSMFRIF